MSIVVSVAEAPAVQDVAAFAIVLLLIGLPLAHWGGVFRRRSVVGPERWESRGDLGGMFITLGVALVAWLGLQWAIFSYKAGTLTPEQRQGDLLSLLSPGETALLMTLPGVVGALVLVGGNFLLGRGLVTRLGYGLRHFLDSTWPAFAGIAIVLPFVFAIGSFATLIYQLVGYEHPEAHDVLLQLKTATGGWARWGLLLGAVVVAPVFEELLFRAHLQTILAAFFDRLSRRSEVPEATPTPALAPRGGFPVGEADPNFTTIPYAQPGPVARAWPRWAAILTTALLFALVHAAWTAPPIFLLAVAFGYAYERTGNLWVCILMHAMFNAVSTAIYVSVPT
ncbi:MAG TPA: CPBP family intramembrane glutamic endopeptidase [Tepidisphaeraceae bacterium]|jgi:membrane protease YdiL (CAAX protease family)|nr:CPBP family intramembrane glutamic endopeptidase [Tepidisphaeraceae bacterium]